jgi:hypothetical protein
MAMITVPFRFGIEGVYNRDMKVDELLKTIREKMVGTFSSKDDTVKVIIDTVDLDSCDNFLLKGTVTCREFYQTGSGFYVIEDVLDAMGKVFRVGRNMFIIRSIWSRA